MHRIDVLSEIEAVGRCLTGDEPCPAQPMPAAIAQLVASWYVLHDRVNQLEAEVAELRRAA